MKEKFIERLKELMKEKGKSASQLSKDINCDFQAVSRWLQGKYYPRYYILMDLSNYFNCSIDYILGLSDEYKNSEFKFKTDFKGRLLAFLEERKITKYHLAKVCKIRESTISKWVNQGRVPETSSLINLAVFFGCSVDYLLGRE